MLPLFVEALFTPLSREPIRIYKGRRDLDAPEQSEDTTFFFEFMLIRDGG